MNQKSFDNCMYMRYISDKSKNIGVIRLPIPKGYQPAQRMTAKERVFNQLQHWIIDGTLEPGEQLYDAEIAEAFGVSRTPVREALLLLEMQGFVKMYRGRETKVSEIVKEDIFKLYPPLASLQALAAETAISVIAREHIEQLRELNQEYEYAIRSGNTYRAMEMDEHFHHLIIERADNPYITDFTSILQLHARRFKYIFLKQPLNVTFQSVKEHESLISAFEEKNVQLAVKVMKENWIRPMLEVYERISN